MKRLFERKSLEVLMELLNEDAGEHQKLHRVLGPVALTALGIGTIIGAGIFVVVGAAAHDKTGPALIVSLMVSGMACLFAALCYAEFASMAPVAGSAYTYAYATLGEVFAWIIGWDLILEYTVASSSVAHGWSHYFQSLLEMFNIHIPEALSRAPFDTDPLTGQMALTGTFIDLPALIISAILTVIIVIGIKESARFNAVMVVIKLAVVLLVIGLGVFYINPANWVPFAPYGWKGLSFFGDWAVWGAGPDGKPIGMLAGAGIMFFAYIGFDAVSTQAEEARNPQRDVPIGIIASLIICTVLYISVAAVLTGMVPYDQINIDAPISDAFARVGKPWAQFVISIGALAGITSVQMVLMLSQPRILMAMARDGLLPKKFFGAIHPRFRTPWKSTILTGVCVGVLSAVIPLRILLELVNIGTLLAFVIVCAAVLIMRRLRPEVERPFRCPFVPFVPIAGVLMCFMLMLALPSENWLRLMVWLAIGFVIYFAYGRHHSILAQIRARNGE
ncbi:MAG: amino acid permease [FCB group bacterium]|jgi:APA family basic amino acid/polyamine antiporter|nr:amino acid permease [FCB group bacterium]